MRLLLITAVIVALSGCRTPEHAFHAKTRSASNWQTEPPVSTVVQESQDDRYLIEDLVRIGLINSPRVRQASHRVQAIQCRIPQELALPDPMLNTTTHLSPIETAAGRQAFAVGVSQKYLDGDRRATKAAIAYEELRVAQSEVSRVQQQLAEQIRVAGFQLLATQATLRMTREDFESLEQLEEVVLRRYEVDRDVSQQDVLALQAEQSKIEIQIHELKQKEHTLSSRLVRLVHMDAGTKIRLDDSLSQTSATPDDVELLIAQAFAARPELTAQYAQIRRDQQRVCLADLQNKPDFTVGLNYIATSSDGLSPVANGRDALLLGIGFNLPVRKDRIRAAKSEAHHTAHASSAELEAIQDEVAEEVFDTCAKLESNAMTATLLREDIIPKAERILDLSLEEYAEGKASFAESIENWRAVLRYRVTLAQTQSMGMQLRATLTRQIGSIEQDSRADASDTLADLIYGESEGVRGEQKRSGGEFTAIADPAP